ncbi:DSHCT domain protein [Dictyocaulus viviparus]|uniref:DSHCT domain protein n=1 Tax=Dictyocaulus viviparus TaxID=29172 RepID=A0A0D8Y622_DICVI|nr:DSHCT domain protein [Dictyocaulus viviparus]
MPLRWFEMWYFEKFSYRCDEQTKPISDGVLKIVHEMDKITEKWVSTGPELIDLAVDINVVDIEMNAQLKGFLEHRQELMDSSKHVVRNCMKFREHVLKELGYVDNLGMVTFRGRVACEIHHQELLITELILRKKLHEKTPAEVAAMLSATTCQYRSGEGPVFDKDDVFQGLKDDVLSVNKKIEETSSRLGVRLFDVADELRFDLMKVVYQWASGTVTFLSTFLGSIPIFLSLFNERN